MAAPKRLALALALTLAGGAAFGVGGCRPVVRACSSVDSCGQGAACVGGRCEARGLPATIATAERIVLAPTRARYVKLGGESALLLAFEPPPLPEGALIEAHLLLRIPRSAPAAGWTRVHRMSGGWHEGSTSVADALAALGPVESESRRLEVGSDLVRLPVSPDSVLRQRDLGWAVQASPMFDEASGTRLAEPSEDGPRLELYVRGAASTALTDRLTAPASTR